VSRFRAGTASAALAAALTGVAVGARGGTALGRTGAVELLLVAAGVLLVCAAVLFGRRERAHGAWAVAAFAALAIVTALSIDWSIDPNASFVETGRTLAYFAAFAAAVAAARLAPAGAPVVARAVLLAAVAIVAYGFAARIWPGSFDESEFSGRISQPFDYWNALAGAAAVGLVPGLWVGSRRSGWALGRALAYPAVGVLIAAILIAQSRGALAGALVACAAWLALVPLRLRSLVVLAVSAAGAAPLTAWALSQDAFRLNMQRISTREAIAGEFGLRCLLTVVGLTLAGLVVVAIQRRLRPAPSVRVRAGQAVAAVAALGAIAVIASVALSDRGLAGTVSDRVGDFTHENADTPVGGGRLASTSSSRAGYWSEAWRAFEERPANGLGAGSFELARLRHRDNGFHASHAHGFVHQTLADLGVIGVLAALALLATWLAAASRATGIGPRSRRRPVAWTDERGALVALTLGAIAYGVQSAADWTWFIPGLTVMALVAAGFVAGAGPLPTIGAIRAAGGDAAGAWRAPLRLAGAAATVLAGLVCAWTIWQPVASDRAVARGYELLDAGRPRAALEEVERAHDLNSYAKDPLYAKADALADIGREADALRTFGEVAREHPRDPDPWVRIAVFQLDVLGSPEQALKAVEFGFLRDGRSQTLSHVRDDVNAFVARGGRPATQ
jgi:O-Antigen ligase